MNALKNIFPYFRFGWAIAWTLIPSIVVSVFSRHFALMIGLVIFILYLGQSTGNWRRFVFVAAIGAAMVWLLFFQSFTL